MIHVMPASITLVISQLWISSSSIDLRSVSFSLIHSHRPGRALADEHDDRLGEHLQGVDDRLADHLHRDAADVLPRQPEDLQDEAEDALEVELRGQLDAGAGDGPEDPVEQALLEVLDDVVLEVGDPLHHRLDEVREEPDRVLDDQRDHRRRLGQDLESSRFLNSMIFLIRPTVAS